MPCGSQVGGCCSDPIGAFDRLELLDHDIAMWRLRGLYLRAESEYRQVVGHHESPIDSSQPSDVIARCEELATAALIWRGPVGIHPLQPCYKLLLRLPHMSFVERSLRELLELELRFRKRPAACVVDWHSA